MTIDLYSRNIDYLRLAVTSHCNLACSFCAPEYYDCSAASTSDLSTGDLLKIVAAAAEIGFKKVRLTGGEPLLRKDIVELISSVRKIPGIEEVTLTSNGTLLAGMARVLYVSGIRRININLPTLNAEKYKIITCRSLLNDVLNGIKNAKENDIAVKINVVATSRLDEEDVVLFGAMAKEFSLKIRFIEYMPLSFDPMVSSLSMETLRGWLLKHDLKAEMIAAMEEPFCDKCNRLRVSASGGVFPCLFGGPSHDLSEVLKGGVSDIKTVLSESIRCKPWSYSNSFADENYRPVIRNVGG